MEKETVNSLQSLVNSLQSLGRAIRTKKPKFQKIIEVPIKNVHNLVSEGKIMVSLGALLEKNKFSIADLHYAHYVFFNDGRRIYFYKTKNPHFKQKRFWSVNNKHVKRLFVEKLAEELSKI